MRRIRRKWMLPQCSAGAQITPIYPINVINQTIPLILGKKYTQKGLLWPLRLDMNNTSQQIGVRNCLSSPPIVKGCVREVVGSIYWKLGCDKEEGGRVTRSTGSPGSTWLATTHPSGSWPLVPLALKSGPFRPTPGGNKQHAVQHRNLFQEVSTVQRENGNEGEIQFQRLVYNTKQRTTLPHIS